MSLNKMLKLPFTVSVRNPIERQQDDDGSKLKFYSPVTIHARPNRGSSGTSTSDHPTTVATQPPRISNLRSLTNDDIRPSGPYAILETDGPVDQVFKKIMNSARNRDDCLLVFERRLLDQLSDVTEGLSYEQVKELTEQIFNRGKESNVDLLDPSRAGRRFFENMGIIGILANGRAGEERNRYLNEVARKIEQLPYPWTYGFMEGGKWKVELGYIGEKPWEERAADDAKKARSEMIVHIFRQMSGNAADFKPLIEKVTPQLYHIPTLIDGLKLTDNYGICSQVRSRIETHLSEASDSATNE